MVTGVVMATLLAASVAPNAGQAEFHLICKGGGTVTRQSTSSASAYSSNGNSATAYSTVNGALPFDGVMRIDISGSKGEVRVPAVMLPPIRGGDDGVMKLKDIRIDDAEITARVAYNFVNKPRIVIDRLAGTVSMDDRMTGAQFTGRCEAFDASKQERAF